MFYPQRQVCHADMERAAAVWLYEHLHEDAPYHDGTFTSWAKKRSLSHPYRFDDGVTLWVADTDINPDDQFLTREAVFGGDSQGARSPLGD